MVVKRTTNKTDVVKSDTNYCTMQLSTRCRNKNGVLPVSEFYTASENVFYTNGRFNICKNCLKEYVYSDDEVNVNKFKTILRIFDLPFYKTEWESSLGDNKETIGTYMKNLSLNHKGKNWIDGDILEETDIDLLNSRNSDKELIMRWGYGFSNFELQWLENTYHEWLTNHNCDQLSVQKLVQMICVKELEIRNARQSGKPTEKMEKSLMELMNSSNLTPRTMSAMNETDSTKVYGVWIKDIENYKPAEYFKDKSIYDDYDGIKDYFNRFILRPMRNLLSNSRDFDKEFMIENEDEIGDE